MWLFTTFGFFSVIQHRDDPELLLVRARVKGDLEKLKEKYLPNLGEIVYMPTADYPHRALAWKVEIAEAAKLAFMDINYTNFKSEVSKRQGGPRHDLYMRVWSVMKDAEREMKRIGEQDARSAKAWKETKSWNSTGKQSQLGFFGRNDDALGFSVHRKETKENIDFASSRKAREARLRDSHLRLAKRESREDKEGDPQETLEDAQAFAHQEEIIASTDEQLWCPDCRLFGGHKRGCTYKR